MNVSPEALKEVSKCLDRLSVSLGATKNQFSFCGTYEGKINKVNAIGDNELELTVEKYGGKKSVFRISAITKEDGRAILEITRTNEK